MPITKDDIRASVASGTITELQAANILALSDARRGARENLEGLDEPFELFKGFNEIFIVVGIGILFAGWSSLTGFLVKPDIFTAICGIIGTIVTYFLAKYFTLKRRMIAPSIALSVMFAASAVQAGVGFSSYISDDAAMTWVLSSILTLVCTLIYWIKFRVPFTLLLIALSVFSSALGILTINEIITRDARDMFFEAGSGPISYLTLILGLTALAIALRFDMSDPHRVTRRSQNGFWLHIIAAPAIVNTIALTLFQLDTAIAFIGLVIFLLLMSSFAIVIDRRSFLISGIGYTVALASKTGFTSASVTILLLGLALVFLGAKWTDIRRTLMKRLPEFTGKEKLPPYEKDAT